MNIKAPAESGLGRATIGLATVLLVMLWTLSAQAATAFTGDKIQGLPVIAQLDVNDLEPGKTQRFMFQGVEMGSGEFWYVPVIVTKGAKPGKRILLVSGVHGDELNSVAAVQQVFAKLDASTLSGSVIGILGPNRPGVVTGWRLGAPEKRDGSSSCSTSFGHAGLDVAISTGAIFYILVDRIARHFQTRSKRGAVRDAAAVDVSSGTRSLLADFSRSRPTPAAPRARRSRDRAFAAGAPAVGLNGCTTPRTCRRPRRRKRPRHLKTGTRSPRRVSPAGRR